MKYIVRKAKYLFRMGMFFALVTLPGIVFANSQGTTPGTKLENPLGKDTTLYTFVKNILGVARNIGLLVAVFFIVYAGFLFVTARGDEAKLKTAKNTFLWTIVGTAILLGAWVLAVAIEGTIKKLGAS